MGSHFVPKYPGEAGFSQPDILVNLGPGIQPEEKKKPKKKKPEKPEKEEKPVGQKFDNAIEGNADESKIGLGTTGPQLSDNIGLGKTSAPVGSSGGLGSLGDLGKTQTSGFGGGQAA